MFSQISTSSSPFSSPSSLVTQKLSSDNFLLWKGQIVPIARGFGIMGYLDGSIPKPSEFTEKTSDDDASKTISAPNPDYEKWYVQDQQVIAWINSTLSPEILAQVIDITSAKLLWSTLNESYAQQSEVRLLHLRTELQNTKRDGKPIDDYLNRMKRIFDQLAIIQHPVEDSEKVRYILGGLGEEYKMLVIALLAKPPLPAYSTLRPLLLQHELMIQKENENVVAATQTQNAGVHNVLFTSDRRYRGRGMFPRGRGRGNFNHGGATPASTSGRGYGPNRQFNNQGRGLLPTPKHTQSDSSPCQICGRSNHLAPNFYYRYKGQGESMALTHSASPNDNWVLDSGATNHVAEDLGSSIGENPR